MPAVTIEYYHDTPCAHVVIGDRSVGFGDDRLRDLCGDENCETHIYYDSQACVAQLPHLHLVAWAFDPKLRERLVASANTTEAINVIFRCLSDEQRLVELVEWMLQKEFEEGEKSGERKRSEAILKLLNL